MNKTFLILEVFVVSIEPKMKDMIISFAVTSRRFHRVYHVTLRITQYVTKIWLE